MMTKVAKVVACVLIILNFQFSIFNFSLAQEIPIGTWRTHSSFNAIHSVSIGSNNIYAASSNGVMIFNKLNNSISSVTKLDGLSSTDITQVAVDQPRQQVLISYSDGNLDILTENEIINFDRLKNSTTITGSKRINHIMMNDNIAYLSTDYGVVAFDLAQLEVKETWRDLGSTGEKIKIYQSTFFNDSIFLATENGVMAGDISDNLLDFNNWQRFNSGAFNGNIQSITTFNGKVYAAINSSGIHSYVNGSWTLESFLPGLSYRNITGGVTKLFLTEGSNLHAVDALNNVTPISSAHLVKPVIALEDTANKLWVGDERNGLVSDNTGSFESYKPNGPTFSNGFRLKYAQRVDYNNNDMMYAVSGGFLSNSLPAQKQEYLNYFMQGSWIAETLFTDGDLTDVDFLPSSKTCLASYGQGLQVIHESAVKDFYNHTNSTLVNNRITAIESSSGVLWVAEYGTPKPLHKFDPVSGLWQSYSLPHQYPVEIKVDFLGNVWMLQDPANGGGILVFDEKGNRTAYLTEVTGSGSLPSRSVYSIAMDRDGQVWVGTAAGAAYFPDPSNIFSGNVNSVKPVFEGRFLLRDERVTSIEVDGGNRKWMGTERGVWLFNPFGEKEVYNFNAVNSPLLSDKIVDIEISGQSGEIFFITDAGIVSFRSDATISDATFGTVKIFPNPVTAEFNGQVGISGLTTDANVKITDISGKLIWQTHANGGTASWNVRDYNGRRAATGMYLVLSTAQDGSESIVGKIAVVD